MKIAELIVRLQERPDWHALDAVVRGKGGLRDVEVIGYNNSTVCLEEAYGEPASVEEQFRIMKSLERADAVRLAMTMIEHTSVWNEYLERAYIVMREVRTKPLIVLQDDYSKAQGYA